MTLNTIGIKKIGHALIVFVVFIAFLVIVIPSGSEIMAKRFSAADIATRFPGYPTQVFDINGNTITIIASRTALQRTTGLSGQEFLNKDEAMLFVFDTPGQYNFWMKDMNFPIDIVWLDSSGTITHIENNVQPETYPALFGPNRADTLYVLEFAAGQVDVLNLFTGLKINFS